MRDPGMPRGDRPGGRADRAGRHLQRPAAPHRLPRRRGPRPGQHLLPRPARRAAQLATNRESDQGVLGRPGRPGRLQTSTRPSGAASAMPCTEPPPTSTEPQPGRKAVTPGRRQARAHRGRVVQSAHPEHPSPFGQTAYGARYDPGPRPSRSSFILPWLVPSILAALRPGYGRWCPWPDTAIAAQRSARHPLVGGRVLQAPHGICAHADHVVVVVAAGRVLGGLDPPPTHARTRPARTAPKPEDARSRLRPGTRRVARVSAAPLAVLGGARGDAGRAGAAGDRGAAEPGARRRPANPSPAWWQLTVSAVLVVAASART